MKTVVQDDDKAGGSRRTRVGRGSSEWQSVSALPLGSSTGRESHDNKQRELLL